jgi:hypothetical protein
VHSARLEAIEAAERAAAREVKNAGGTTFSLGDPADDEVLQHVSQTTLREQQRITNTRDPYRPFYRFKVGEIAAIALPTGVLVKIDTKRIIVRILEDNGALQPFYKV